MRNLTLFLIFILTLGTLVAWTALAPFLSSKPSDEDPLAHDLNPVIEKADAFFEKRWKDLDFEPATRAEDLQIYRRISLALIGRIPSLEEIRLFEADTSPQRIRRWTLHLIRDRQSSRYLSEQLSDALLTEQRFSYFQEHFRKWLADEIHRGRPYDELTRDLIATDGHLGSEPQTWFIRGEVQMGTEYQQRLAARTARFFLGQRIDCAQCHDHPFDYWKQSDFEGIAAFFGQIRPSHAGLHDNLNRRWTIEDRKIEPKLPFSKEWDKENGTFRKRLADWVTHQQNRRFRRAIVNRIWGVVFGRPFVTPVDGVPDPSPKGEEDETRILDLLGDDFQAHGYDLRRLVLVMTELRVFRLDSRHPALEDEKTADGVEEAWAVFPMSRLRPDQLARSVFQSGSIKAMRRGSTIVSQTRQWAKERRFIEEIGEESRETIPQTLFRMNGRFTREVVRPRFWNASGRIVKSTSDAEQTLETAYLVCLSRRPTREEKQHFLARLKDARGGQTQREVEDLFWALINSAEFSWNH